MTHRLKPMNICSVNRSLDRRLIRTTPSLVSRPLKLLLFLPKVNVLSSNLTSLHVDGDAVSRRLQEHYRRQPSVPFVTTLILLEDENFEHHTINCATPGCGANYTLTHTLALASRWKGIPVARFMPLKSNGDELFL
jgi:hypothetical protein